jgi:hypothetical protein
MASFREVSIDSNRRPTLCIPRVRVSRLTQQIASIQNKTICITWHLTSEARFREARSQIWFTNEKDCVRMGVRVFVWAYLLRNESVVTLMDAHIGDMQLFTVGQ